MKQRHVLLTEEKNGHTENPNSVPEHIRLSEQSRALEDNSLKAEVQRGFSEQLETRPVESKMKHMKLSLRQQKHIPAAPVSRTDKPVSET